jgi:polysaccharide deacetylase family protein (PEP-CTERM system associated)
MTSVSAGGQHRQLASQARPDSERTGPRPRSHLLTIALEDYFHNFERVIQRAHWPRFEMRVEQSTRRALDLLDEFGIRATFFTLGWIANTVPEVIREVASRGHEIASKGYSQQRVRALSVEEFRDDLARAREALEKASGQRVIGYRAAGWLRPTDTWALRVLAEEGYVYDSSFKPLFFRYGAYPSSWRQAHQRSYGEHTLWEFPISSFEIGPFALPIGAGNYFRQLPDSLQEHAVAWRARHGDAPFTMYFHTWELDQDQPQITAAPLLARVKYYRNLHKVPEILRRYFAHYTFTNIRDYLGLHVQPAATDGGVDGVPASSPAPRGESPIVLAPAPRAASGARRVGVPVTLVVPCYNEEHSLPYLANTLRSVEQSLAGEYAFDFIFVDDCSTDDTWNTLQRLFGDRANCTIIKHRYNGGVAAGILTGIRAARTELVASIDCDCTYDPHELGNMMALLTDDVDVVTASPYHPLGTVKNVPGWRLMLSRNLSILYRMVLHQKLSTYTACFRVYRRDAVLPLRLERGGFLGVAEMLGKLDLAGARLAEYPTTLNVRVLGYSKMKVARTIAGHLLLLSELLRLRLTERGRGHGARSHADQRLDGGST